MDNNVKLGKQALPDSWERVPIRRLLIIHYGKGLTKSDREEGGDVLVFGSSGIVGSHDQALVDGPCIVVGRKGSVGKVYLSRVPCWPIDTTYYIHPGEFLDAGYVYHLLDSLDLGALDKSTAIPGLNRDDFYAQIVPVAPLPEQRRIVAEIEAQFSRLDAVIATLERLQANLKRYHASVLKAACEGRLVPTEAELARQEGRDYEPAEVLLERILAERRARWEAAQWEKQIERASKKAAQARRKAAGLPAGLGDLSAEEWQDLPEPEYAPYLPKSNKSKYEYNEPESPEIENLGKLPRAWVWTDLAQLKAFSLYGPRYSSDQYSEIGRVVVRTSDINASGKVCLENAPRLPLDDDEFASYRCRPGDLLVTRTGSLGTLAVFNDDIDAIPGAYLIQYRLVAPMDTSWYVFYVLKSPSGQNHLIGKGAGVGRPNLNAPTIEKFPIPLPPLVEQRRIVQEVERRLSMADALDEIIDTSLNRAHRLRKSILKRAFEGRLVPQDPADEPASALLERIQAQKDGRTRENVPVEPQQMRLPDM